MAVLILVRHGSAGEALTDSERPLTNLGRSEVEALLRALQHRAVRSDRVLHSGLRRAAETAEILSSLSGANPTEHAGMTPEDDPDTVIAELDGMGGVTMIVSHLPFLPRLCDELLEDVTVLPEFRTATAVCLQSEETKRRTWSFQWQINGRDELLRER